MRGLRPSRYEGAQQRNAVALAAAFLLLWSVPTAAEDPLPVPRFVSLKSDRVNMRTGPGRTYPVEWVFTRKGLPVEILREYEHWREIRDVEATRGWVHRAMLSGSRTVVVTGAAARTAHEGPSREAPPAWTAEPGVQGSLLACEPDWCRVAVRGVDGWLPMSALWGVYAADGGEAP